MPGKKRKLKVFDVCLYTFFVLVGFIMLYPLWTVLMGSIMPYNEYAASTLKIWPTSVTFEAFRVFFTQEAFLVPLKNSLIYAIGGTVLSMVVTTMAAYALSKKRLLGRNVIMLLFYFTTMFAGGTTATYITMKGYGLLDTIFSVVFLMTVDTVYLIIMRTHFASIPVEIEEAAMIDGAGDFRTLLQIMLPISKPTLATITLFYAVNKWTDYYSPLFLIRSEENHVLQQTLYNIIFVGTQNPMKNQFTLLSQTDVAADSLRMAAVIAVTLPILLVYPFLQKHFTKGVMVGSVKG